MARVKIVYIGGGSTRGPGTVATMIMKAAELGGSEIVLVDPNTAGVDLTRRIAERFIAAQGADLRVSTLNDRRAALRDADFVLTSFRPGGFEARVQDEKIPLKHGVIGQETQGPGGFFMALRAVEAFKGIVADMETVCPNAWLINYTNPINVVSEAITHHTALRCYSFCEGPLYFSRAPVQACGLDFAKADILMIGLNHACWSVRADYEGQDLIDLISAAAPRVLADTSISQTTRWQVELTAALGTIPADYMQYYYYRDVVLADLQSRPQTRAEWILSQTPKYIEHYRQQAESNQPHLDPALSRGGITELELAVDAIVAIANDSGQVLPVNLPNNGSITGFPNDLVVETWARFDRHGAHPFVCGPIPPSVRALTYALGQYQALAGEAAWSGDRHAAIQALSSHPLVPSLQMATALFDELAHAHRAYLPERLLT